MYPQIIQIRSFYFESDHFSVDQRGIKGLSGAFADALDKPLILGHWIRFPYALHDLMSSRLDTHDLVLMNGSDTT